jgi:hypothetical protein
MALCIPFSVTFIVGTGFLAKYGVLCECGNMSVSEFLPWNELLDCYTETFEPLVPKVRSATSSEGIRESIHFSNGCFEVY